MQCNQVNCGKPATYRFTWPGRDEAGICEDHAPKLKAVANAMGLPLQMISLAPGPEVVPDLRPLDDKR